MKLYRLTVLRVVALLGLGTSALLLSEYLEPTYTLCGTGGGCNTVRESAYSHLAGVPLPVFGIAFFALVLALSFARGARPLTALLACAGAVGALALIAVQAVIIDAFCLYCMIVDVSAVAAGALALSLRSVPPRSGQSGGLVAYGVAALAVVSLGLAVPRLVSGAAERVVMAEPAAELPDAVAAAQVPGKLTIVEFVDFQCPICRAQHEHFSQVLRDYGDKVVLVYKHWPLPMHRHAMSAARAALCGEQQGKGKAMVAKLFRADDLTARGGEILAGELGLDPEQFRACVASEPIQQHIDRDVEAAKALGLRGVPTYWIGRRKLDGGNGPGVLRAHIDAELAAMGKR